MINATKLTGRRSVIALPLVGPPTSAIDYIVGKAVKENIVIVAAAGKQKSKNVSICVVHTTIFLQGTS